MNVGELVFLERPPRGGLFPDKRHMISNDYSPTSWLRGITSIISRMTGNTEGILKSALI
jgi:hypothetical protein